MKNTNLIKRFLRYIKMDTQCSAENDCCPSTEKQRFFAAMLAEEMRNIGIQNVRISENALVFGCLPASPGYEESPALGLISHMDTALEAPGGCLHPGIVENYDGSVIPLGTSGKTLDPALFQNLLEVKGHTLITTDGTTLLGADDKAGIAEIMTVAEMLLASGEPHGKICFGFTPDEEIVRGVQYFDVVDFGADFAYTVDGGRCYEIKYQNFNAASGTFVIQGRSIHPGAAKDQMINACGIAVEIASMLPADQKPEKTEGKEGFFHLYQMEGDVNSASLKYLVRDHDNTEFERKKALLRDIASVMCRQYGQQTVHLELKDQYHNMEKVIDRYPFLIEIAENAVRDSGYDPKIVPIRGGTDGAFLSLRGLPCPNLGTGGRNCHGEYEFISVQEMNAVVQMLLSIIRQFRSLRERNRENR